MICLVLQCRSLWQAAAVVFVATAPVVAQERIPIDLLWPSAVGSRFSETDGSYLIVDETAVGHRVEVSFTGIGHRTFVDTYGAKFNVDGWMVLRVEENRPMEAFGFGAVRFNPYDDINEPLVRSGDEFYLQPSPRGYGIGFAHELPYGPGEPATAVFEYSLHRIPDPLVGDFNFDNVVGFDDFTTLAGSFGRTGIFWKDGDTNLDGAVQFDDFLLMSASFGQSRVIDQTVSAPEPAFTSLFGAELGYLVFRLANRNGRSRPRRIAKL